MMDIESTIGRITGVRVTPFALSEPFIDLAGRFSLRSGTILLMSGSDLDCARYHILGVNPWLKLRAFGSETVLTVDECTVNLRVNPFDVLHRVYQLLRFPESLCREGIGGHDALPLHSGLLGYLSYDLKDALEVLPRTSVDDLKLPHLFMVVPSVILIHDRESRTTWQCIPERFGGGDSPTLSAIEKAFLEDSRSLSQSETSFVGDIETAKSGFTRDGYMAAVNAVKDYIEAGDVYQVNLSQRFDMAFRGDPYRLFKRLFELNPAPFFAFIHAEDHVIVSTSPERFIKLNGTRVETRPIKGTRPRGVSSESDNGFREELLSSRKDDAELSMIVDLLRNDIGKVCVAGSVRVLDHKRLEAYRNVYHLVSIVEGELSAERDAIDLIRATFPGGSITGCPKIRSMEIIDELEPTRRHIYTGSIGYISFHGAIDLSIAIRTATVVNGRLCFSVGGGIVFDSDPGDEYEETLHKGDTLMSVLHAPKSTDAHGRKDESPIVWLNGALLPSDGARIPISDQGVLYGYGFFETVRAVNGDLKRFELHMDRFERTWRCLFQTSPPDLTWEDIIRQVLRRNGLSQSIAAVKLLATRGDRLVSPYNHNLFVSAIPYTHRLEGLSEKGLRLAIYPEARLTPLADHKTTNYLYYLRAGLWAKANNADEALILNPDGSVSETNTAGILVVSDRSIFLPVSDHVLPSTMQRHVCGLLTEWGYTVLKRRLWPTDLSAADEVLLVNSLIGALPALSIDALKMKSPSDLFLRINSAVL